jgi:hypothetical protein
MLIGSAESTDHDPRHPSPRGRGHGPLGTQCVVGILVALILSWPTPSLAVGARTRPAWSLSSHVYAQSHGRWEVTTSIASRGELRGVVNVRGRQLPTTRIRVTMALMHLSWQSWKKVIMPPTLVVTMRRQMASNNLAIFEATVRVPTTLPVYWSVVRFVATDGHSRIEDRSGVMVGPPAWRTMTNTLTVGQAGMFCDAQPRLPYLRYAVYLHGYFKSLPTRGDGPAGGIVLDRPRRVTLGVLRVHDYPHGITTFGFNLPKSDTWVTKPGFLLCTNGKPDGFSMTI